MRTKGAITKKECFNCKVVMNGEIQQDRNYVNLRDVAKDLNMTYNQVVEITRNRRKIKTGKYDTNYFIGKIKQNNKDIKDNEIPSECIDEEGNIDEFLLEQIGQSHQLNL
tara:strand:- start:4808 stop:5137 length:330 start_codon:yes stop_codon:yes gene_type:complete